MQYNTPVLAYDSNAKKMASHVCCVPELRRLQLSQLNLLFDPKQAVANLGKAPHTQCACMVLVEQMFKEVRAHQME